MDDDLSHEYDAAQRRAYYLRTRQLKGRKSGAGDVSPTRRLPKAKPPVKTRAQRQAERRRHLEAQVEALKARLQKLREVLAKQVEAAQIRSGQTPKKASEKTSQTKSPGKTTKQTAKQKADASKRSKEYYEKNKDEILADEVKSLNQKIKAIQERIAKMRKNGSIGTQRASAK